jgi:hypothetical protein
MQTRVLHPSFGETLRVGTSYVREDPDGQVADTIHLMQRYVSEDARSPQIRHDALEAVGSRDPSHIPQPEILNRVFQYVKGKIQFTGDELLSAGTGLEDQGPPVVEVLIRPKDMADLCTSSGCQRLGDCDDFSMYTAALLTALGIKAVFVTVAADQAHPELFSHVYVAAYTNEGERVALDTSHGPRLGWETPNRTRIQEWPIGGIAGDGMALAAGMAIAFLLLRGGL